MNDTLAGSPILTNWLAIVGIISLMYWGWRIVAAVQHRTRKSAPEDPVAAPARSPALAGSFVPASDGFPDDIVAIAAAVHAMMGAHRIVRLEVHSDWPDLGRRRALDAPDLPSARLRHYPRT